MNIALFGAPGAGKGTQSAALVDRKGMKHISTGDLFRYAIKNETPLGLEAKKYIDAGNLVPDAVTIGLVREELKCVGDTGFILDGFPRTVPQAEALEGLLQENGKTLDQVLFLEVPKGQLMSRLTGRRVCKSCGAVNHIDAKPTKIEGVCDICGGESVQRIDDQEETIANRLDVYENSTAPLKSFYKEAGKLVELDGTGPTDEVFERIQEVLDRN
ncbi:MAG: adenylate kinase [Bdellovibrionales bacterium]|nr:adenylate kinase [Bdellovibrionales bacterium]